MKKREFAFKYGKVKPARLCGGRVPVRAYGGNDINRKLMIGFKYGTLSASENNQFHEAIRKIIYRVMHTNNVMMDWDDVYQEIWKKIIRYRHTWKESRGTKVSTWVTIVANSVINTLRNTVRRYRSRYMLYNDMVDEEEETGEEYADVLALKNGSAPDAAGGMCAAIDLVEFRKSLTKPEAMALDAMLAIGGEIMKAYSSGSRMPIEKIAEKCGLDECELRLALAGMGEKAVRMGLASGECEWLKSVGRPDDDSNETLF